MAGFVAGYDLCGGIWQAECIKLVKIKVEHGIPFTGDRVSVEIKLPVGWVEILL